MENKVLLDNFIKTQKQLDICFYKIRQLSINEQIELLNLAFKQGNEKEALLYIYKVEPLGFKNSNRELSKALLDMLISIATYPGNSEIEAMDLLVELSTNFKEFKELIYDRTLPFLNEADNDSDYEVYQRTGDLLKEINSEKINEFIDRCKNHSSKDINLLIDNWI